MADGLRAQPVKQLLYSLAWYLATPLVVMHLLWRSRRQPEYLRHWNERWSLLGRRPAAQRPIVWIHAVSVGETRAAQTLIVALERDYPHLQILLTAMTPTGRQTGEQLFGDRVLRSYLPYDYPGAMRRFIEYWRPQAAIIMETELWPNLMANCVRHSVPVCLVNARLSQRSLRKGARWGGLISVALKQLSAIAVQSEADAQRLRTLGARQLTITGNMKFDITPAPQQLELGRHWRAKIAARSVVLAASTREGEERLLLAQWRRHASAATGARPLLVIVPRHPQRFEEVGELIREAGLSMTRRSQFGAGSAARAQAAEAGEVDVLLGDSMGEMSAYYAMADVAILGGSLLEFGGQNLIESCAVGTRIILGQHTFNFDEAAAGDCACAPPAGLIPRSRRSQSRSTF